MFEYETALDLPVVETPSDLPAFASEAEEAEFWATHQPGDGFFNCPDVITFPISLVRER